MFLDDGYLKYVCWTLYDEERNIPICSWMMVTSNMLAGHFMMRNILMYLDDDYLKYVGWTLYDKKYPNMFLDDGFLKYVG